MNALKSSDNPAAAALVELPKLFGGFEVFDEAKKVLHGDVLESKLSRLQKLCEDISGIIPLEKIRVDLGLINKKNYYTGIIFRGYVEGYGQPALSGGRYDALLGDFGREAAAVGFAVNVEAVAKVYMKEHKEKLRKIPDVLVFGEKGAEIAALAHCEKLISEGKTVYNFLGGCPKCAAKYAEAHNIPRVDIVNKDGKISSEEV